MQAQVGAGCFDLSGRVAIVTGASRGLGRAACISLAKYGADVVCAGRDRRALDETAQLVTEHGQKVLVVEADVTKPATIQRMADETVREFGRVDILVANAGIAAPWMRIDEESIDQWDTTIATNLTGPFLSMKAVLPTMVGQRSGSIIAVSSIGALGGGHVSPASYGASKSGLIGLVKHAAVQYGEFGIRVNCILPGMHITDLGMPKDEAGRADRLRLLDEVALVTTPLRRVAQADEIEGLVILLASDASRFITGATFVQDGGHTARI
jgi:NAD(P)-dependent dehydrogenase (short-subunit alcohol dehydrogenase family)